MYKMTLDNYNNSLQKLNQIMNQLADSAFKTQPNYKQIREQLSKVNQNFNIINQQIQQILDNEWTILSDDELITEQTPKKSIRVSKRIKKPIIRTGVITGNKLEEIASEFNLDQPLNNKISSNIKQLIKLPCCDITFEIFAKNTDKDGLLTKKTFYNSFIEALDIKSSLYTKDNQLFKLTFDNIWNIIENHRNPVNIYTQNKQLHVNYKKYNSATKIDFIDTMLLVSVFCGDTPLAKIRACWMLLKASSVLTELSNTEILNYLIIINKVRELISGKFIWGFLWNEIIAENTFQKQFQSETINYNQFKNKMIRNLYL